MQDRSTVRRRERQLALLAPENAVRHTVSGDLGRSVCQRRPGITSREKQMMGSQRAVELIASKTALVSASPGDMAVVSLMQLE